MTVRSFDDIRTDEARAYQVYLILIGLARERKTTTYSLLANEMGFAGAGVFSGILGHIMFWCRDNELPSLTTLVVQTGAGVPGEGLTEPPDKDAEREKIYEFKWYRIVPPTPEELDAAYKRRLSAHGETTDDE